MIETHDARTPVVRRPYRTARTLLRALDITRTCWTPETESACPWIFRGHADARWPLQPPTFREAGPDATVYKQVLARVLREDPRAQALVEKGAEGAWELRLYAQARLVREFAQLADRQGFHVPDADAVWKWRRRDPGAENPITALAQHHRVPTCLLDFTRDPLVALHWSTETPSDGPAHELAVWALYPGAIVSKVQSVSPSYAGNQNLRAQSGLFVHFQQAGDEVLANRPLPCLDTCGGIRVGGLRCFTLPWSQVRELRRLLELRGMDRARLLPSLDGVAQTVVRRYSP